MSITDKAAVTATVQARVWAWVGTEVTVTPCPNTAGLPVVREEERDRLVCILLPSSGVVRNSGADVQVREDLDANGQLSVEIRRRTTTYSRPDGEGALVVDSERTGRRRCGDRKDNGGGEGLHVCEQLEDLEWEVGGVVGGVGGSRRE